MSSETAASTMKQEATTALVPKLRFPEFRGTSGWESQLIGPYLEDRSGRVPPETNLPVYSSTREGLKRQDAYFDGRVLQNKSEYGVVPPGCFVYRHMSDDGLFKFNINETGGEIAVSKEYPVFRTKSLNSVFLLAKLNDGLDFKHFALSKKAGGTRTRLYFSRLCEWRTFLPSFAEQQKIADCLRSLDELIAAQAQKVEALKSHKKGLMQNLFPRTGETQPRLRFPEFQDAGEWEARQLRQVVDLSSGGTPSKANPAFWNGSIPWVSAKDMKQLFLADSADHITLEAVQSGARLVPRGTLLVLTRGMTLLKDIPICFLLREMTFNQDVKAMRPKAGIDGLFLAWMLISNKQHLLQMVNVAGHGTGKIDTDKLISLQLVVPSPAEQQRIASCLSRLDALITAETQKLEAFKTHKKGLMQQLFPSPVEIEG